MTEFHKIWIEQCAAAEGIREDRGLKQALGYLIGEKLMTFVRESDRRPEFAAELPKFVGEICEYLDNVQRVGSAAHVSSDEQYEALRAAGALDEDPVRGAEDVLLLERIRELLSPQAPGPSP